MKTKNITFTQRDGNLHHNRATDGDIVLVQIPLEQAYSHCFEEAIKRYNATQKRKDRQIKESYFNTTFRCEPTHIVVNSATKRKSFYEVYIQVGSAQDTPPAEHPIVIDCLKEYFKQFKKRNTSLYVFNAVIHATDGTPHLHIDYIPVGHFKRGIDTQNSLSQAFREMGYNFGKDSPNRWRMDERGIFESICTNYGLEIKETISKEDYSQLESELSSLKANLAQLSQTLAEEIQTIENTIPESEILHPHGYRERKKWSGGCFVELDKEAFSQIQRVALTTAKTNTLHHNTLHTLQNLLERLKHHDGT